MKKIDKRKLALRTDTIRNLNGGELRKAAGGDSIYETVCLAGYCAPTGDFACAGTALCPGTYGCDGGSGGGGFGGSGGSGLTNYKCVRTD